MKKTITKTTIGEHSVWLRSDGRWTGKVSDEKDGQKVQVAKYGRTAAEVAQKLDEYLRARAEGVVEAGKPKTVGQLVEAFLQSSDWANKKSNTHVSFGSHLRRIARELGHRRVDQLTVRDVEQWLVGLRNRDGSLLSWATFNQTQAVVSCLYSWAIREGGYGARENVGRGPRSGGARCPKDRAKTKPCDPFTLSEIPSLLKALAPDEGLIYELVLNTGLRPEEVLALRVEDVVLTADYGVVKVRRSMAQVEGGKFKVQSPKSDSSIRDVYFAVGSLTKRLGALLAQERTGEWKELLFLDPQTNGPIPQPRYRKTWYALLEAGEVKRRIPYKLRHTYASHRLLRGDSIYDVSKDLGHANTAVTEGHYASQLKEAKMRHAVRPLFEAA